jgi:hypothetical protein
MALIFSKEEKDGFCQSVCCDHCAKFRVGRATTILNNRLPAACWWMEKTSLRLALLRGKKSKLSDDLSTVPGTGSFYLYKATRTPLERYD